MRNVSRPNLWCWLALLYSGAIILQCNPGLTKLVTETQQPLQPLNVAAVNLVQEPGAVQFPLELSYIDLRLERALQNQFYSRGRFKRGQDLSIHYTFLEKNPGDPVTLHWAGAKARSAHGVLIVSVQFLNREKEKLAEIVVNIRLKEGLGGEGFDKAIRAAAKEIFKYTASHFRGGK